MTEHLLIRDDLSDAAPWLNVNDRRHVVDELTDAFADATGNPVRVVTVTEQRHRWQQWLDRNPDSWCVSADMWLRGDRQLALSRIFEHGPQDHAIDVRIRPEAVVNIDSIVVAADRARHSGRQLVFVDDDIVTGATLQAATQLCQVSFDTVVSLAHLDPGGHIAGGDWYDVVDARDFVPGAHGGGLVLDNGQQLQRHSYLDEHVNLERRASLPDTTHLSFRARIRRTLAATASHRHHRRRAHTNPASRPSQPTNTSTLRRDPGRTTTRPYPC